MAADHIVCTRHNFRNHRLKIHFQYFLCYFVVKQNASHRLRVKPQKEYKSGLQKTKYHTTVLCSNGVPKAMNFWLTKNRRSQAPKKSGGTSKPTHHFERPKPAWISVMEFGDEVSQAVRSNFNILVVSGVPHHVTHSLRFGSVSKLPMIKHKMLLLLLLS